MLTANGKIILNYIGAGAHLPQPAYSSGTNNYGILSGKDAAGNTMVFAPYVTSNNSVINSLSGTGNAAPQGFAFGSGTTPATENDFTLESLITTISGSAASPVTYYDSTLNKYRTYIQFTLTNTGSASISISEIGRFWQLYTASAIGSLAGGGGTQRGLLVDHVILDNPVVIAAGESGIVRYEVAYN